MWLYINYPNPHFTIHADPHCGHVERPKKPERLKIVTELVSLEKLIDEFENQEVNFASTRDRNDMWISFDLDLGKDAASTIYKIRSLIGRRYKPLHHAEIKLHCGNNDLEDLLRREGHRFLLKARAEQNEVGPSAVDFIPRTQDNIRLTSKYAGLAKHLINQPQKSITMTFDEVADQTRLKQLPPSATQHREWWTNHPSQTQARNGWRAAGWRVANVDMENKSVQFVREIQTSNLHDNQAGVVEGEDLSNVKDRQVKHKISKLISKAGGIDNLTVIIDAIEGYIAGSIVEVELGRIFRKYWPRGE